MGQAIGQLSKRHGHFREGLTGVLDYAFERYLKEGEPMGQTLIEWMSRPDYDPKAVKAEFKASWWGTLLTEKLLGRE
jgi:hypothetical protein